MHAGTAMWLAAVPRATSGRFPGRRPRVKSLAYQCSESRRGRRRRRRFVCRWRVGKYCGGLRRDVTASALAALERRNDSRAGDPTVWSLARRRTSCFAIDCAVAAVWAKGGPTFGTQELQRVWIITAERDELMGDKHAPRVTTDTGITGPGAARLTPVGRVSLDRGRFIPNRAGGRLQRAMHPLSDHHTGCGAVVTSRPPTTSAAPRGQRYLNTASTFGKETAQ